MKNVKKLLRISLVTTVCGIAATAVQAQQSPQAPAPRILVVQIQMVVQGSKVGKDIARQIMEYQKQAEAEFKGRQTALQQEQQKLQQQKSLLSAAAFAQKTKDFQSKVAGLQQFGDTKRNLIQGGSYKAQQAIDAALHPILDAILKAHGANLMMERSTIIDSNIDIDATSEAIKRLDQAMPTYKVQLVPLPPEIAAQVAAAAAQQQQR